MSRAVDQPPNCSARMRRAGSQRISPSCRKKGLTSFGKKVARIANAERIQTRRKTRRSPTGHAQQEDGPRERSLRRCDFQPGPNAARFFVRSHEKFVNIARPADKGRSGGTPLRPHQTGTRSSDRSSTNPRQTEGGSDPLYEAIKVWLEGEAPARDRIERPGSES